MNRPGDSTRFIGGEAPDRESRRYEPPTFEVICLECEISTYAPDGGEPLF